MVGAAAGSEPPAWAGAGMNGSSQALEEASWAPFALLCLNYLIVYVLIANNVFCRLVSPFPGEFAGCFIKGFLYTTLVKAMELTPCLCFSTSLHAGVPV